MLGNFASYVYGNGRKTPKKITSEKDLQAMFDAFLQTQKNMATDIEKKYNGFDAWEKFSQKKDKMIESLQSYITQWQKVFWEIKSEIQKDVQVAKKHKRSKKDIS